MAQEISYKKSKSEFSNKLNLDYQIDDIIIVETPYIDNIFLCILSVSSEAKLNELWDILNSVISSELSKYFKNDFQMWNFYLFYLCKEEIGVELKYKIINDKFSSRKVVIDKFDKKIDKQVVEGIIAEYIVGSDIFLDEKVKTRPEESSYYSKSKVFKNIESIYLQGNENLNDKELLEMTLSKIILEIKDED
ncbi:ABC-three component system middle component 1 [Pseudoalteromonas sp. AS71]|uniref:ABC-three component system middle component 1 n=1 Tax=unclassified Pseudoalteromonas TaxID=194690 RepID=UPI0013FDBB9B|nr:ABC-three component system middle component 1 [Pseudoalteromonas sp. Z1A2]